MIFFYSIQAGLFWFGSIIKSMIFALGALNLVNLLPSTSAEGKRNLRSDEEIDDEVVTDEAVSERRMFNLASNVLNAIQTLEEKYNRR